ncbi:hypothetical protein ACEWY4_010276 [Coilia grayii]|uniref:Uncharacterized protein n=1 Tax=Coilia grayii TaxID=363190 RepID=A0ABD1K1E7_9TELE
MKFAWRPALFHVKSVSVHPNSGVGSGVRSFFVRTQVLYMRPLVLLCLRSSSPGVRLFPVCSCFPCLKSPVFGCRLLPVPDSAWLSRSWLRLRIVLSLALQSSGADPCLSLVLLFAPALVNDSCPSSTLLYAPALVNDSCSSSTLLYAPALVNDSCPPSTLLYAPAPVIDSCPSSSAPGTDHRLPTTLRLLPGVGFHRPSAWVFRRLCGYLPALRSC